MRAPYPIRVSAIVRRYAYDIVRTKRFMLVFWCYNPFRVSVLGCALLGFFRSQINGNGIKYDGIRI